MNLRIFKQNVKYKDGLLIGWNYPSILLPVDLFLNIELISKKLYGNEFAYETIKNITKIQGNTAGSFWAKFDIIKKIIARIGKDNLESIGIGRITKMVIKNNYTRIEVESNLAKEYLKKYSKSKKPVCNYISLLLNGPVSKIMGISKIKEKQCIGMGDEVCVFETE